MGIGSRVLLVYNSIKMLLFEIIGEFLFGVVFEGIVMGTLRSLKKVWNRTVHKVPKLPLTQADAIKALEKKILYKNVVVTKDINPGIRAGVKGTILEVIDTKRVFAEFYDLDGQQIEYEGDIVFEVGMDQLKVVK